MTFFKRFPRFWIAVWTVFGLGGLVMAFEAIFGPTFNMLLIGKGLIGLAVGIVMISYLLQVIRKSNAPNP